MTTAPATPPQVVTYFLHNPLTTLVKIGRSTALTARQRDLETMNGTPLRLLGQLPNNVERQYHRQFADARRHGEWFALTPALAEFLRHTFGCRIQAPKERRLQPPRLDGPDVRHDLEALADSALVEPDPYDATADIAAYLFDVFRPGGSLSTDEEDEDVDEVEAQQDREAIVEACDEALGPILACLETWSRHWIGWMAPAAPTPGQFLDVWLAFWRPVGAVAANRLRWALLRAAVATDHDAIEWLRLRPVLVDRDSGALEALPPEELYSDAALGLLRQEAPR